MSLDYENCLKKRKIRPFSRGKTLAPKELETASFDLERAKKSFRDNDYKWATIQLYYSMFHSGRALLYNRNLRERSHFCLIAALRDLYIQTRQLPVSFIEALQKAKNLREEADYYDRWSKTGCQELINSAEEFLEIAREIILKKNSNPSNL